jgi:hypothetical protein
LKNAYCQTLNREFKTSFLTTKCAKAAKVRDYRFAKMINRTFPGTSPGAGHLTGPESEPVFRRQVGGGKCLRPSAVINPANKYIQVGSNLI